MAAIIPRGAPVWGMQLPIQSQSTIFVQPWEATAGPSELAAVARACDQAGAFYVAVCDHAAIPEANVGSMGGVWYDTVATLGWLAAQTEHVALLSHVMVVPYRSPLLVAKAFTTLDALSGGRAILGVGAGHVAGEFELLGADFEQRGATLDASLDVIREAFITGAYQGAAVEPRASRAGGPPIWVGGSSGPAIRRAARVGDGWLPQGPPKMGMRQAIELIKTTREQRGVDPEDFDIGLTTEPLYVGDASFELGEYTLTGSPEEIAARLRRYRKVGANQMQVRFESRSLAELLDQIERFAAEVWPLVTA